LRRSWIAAGIVVATVLALAAQTSVVTRTGLFASDFRAFYCAARVASQGADPYRTQPLGACERSLGSTRFFEKNPKVTIPAPLPGYAIAALIPLTRLPFGAAIAVWLALLFAGWLACVIAIAAFAGVQREVTVAALALSLAALSFPFGEVVPIAVGFICLAGYAAWQDRPRLAALFAAGSMIEPHLGLPVCLTLAVWLSGTRWVLAVCAVVFAGLSLLVLGLPANVEYFTSVLPAHALSELTRDTQYSLSAVLAALGVSPSAAVRGGGLWYVAMLILGTIFAGRVARTTGNRAFLACIPPAFAVFGGTFIHVTQIAAAIPAAILLVSLSKDRERIVAVVALILLAVPWGWVYSPALLVAPFLPIAFLVWQYFRTPATVLISAIGSCAVVLGLQWLFNLTAPHLGAHAALPVMDSRLAESTWALFTGNNSGGSMAAWAVRLPTWAALAAVLALFIARAGFSIERRQIVSSSLALGCTLLPIAAQTYGDRATGWLGVDFRAYYCAALAQRQHRNPYFEKSLHDCEAAPPKSYFRARPGLAVPAPYPPYVLAILAPLTLLPFEDAISVWWTLMALGIVAAVYCLSIVSRQPIAVAAGALGLAAGLTSFSTGNMAPMGIAALVVAAMFVQAGRFAWASVALAAGMLEPQMALPAAVACFILLPAMRASLAGAFLVLALLSAVAVGPANAVAYVSMVVPAHALSEVSRDNQYSLSTIAAALGVGDRAAVLIGSVSYLLMMAVGIFASLRLSRQFDEPSFVVLVPPAISLLGGSFVHTGEVAAAVPAALLLYTRAATLRPWLLAALVLLAVPWMYATSVTLFIAPFFPAAYLVYELWRRDLTLALGVAAASFAAIALLFWLAGQPHAPAAMHPHFHPPIDPRLAEAGWRQLVLGNSTNRLITWLLRLPTWCGLLLLAIPAVLLALRRDPTLALESS
jgi:hypothetical protein